MKYIKKFNESFFGYETHGVTGTHDMIKINDVEVNLVDCNTVEDIDMSQDLTEITTFFIAHFPDGEVDDYYDISIPAKVFCYQAEEELDVNDIEDFFYNYEFEENFKLHPYGKEVIITQYDEENYVITEEDEVDYYPYFEHAKIV